MSSKIVNLANPVNPDRMPSVHTLYSVCTEAVRTQALAEGITICHCVFFDTTSVMAQRNSTLEPRNTIQRKSDFYGVKGQTRVKTRKVVKTENCRQS